MKSKARHAKKKHVASPPGAVTSSPRQGTLYGMLIAVVCALLVATGTWALFEFVIWNVTPPELVGKWVVVEGPQEGATFDFYRNGTLRGIVNVGGKEGIVDAQIHVEGKKIFSTTRNPNTGKDDTLIQNIRTLTATGLILEDEKGSVLKMERAR